DHARGGLDADGACGAALGDAAGDGARGDVCPAGQGNHYADTALTYSGDAPEARGAAVGRAADVRHGVSVTGDGQSTSTAATADVDVPAGDDVAVAVDDVGARAVSGLDSVDVPAGDHAAVDHGDAAGLDNGPVVGAADEHPAARHGAAGVGGHVHHDGGAGQAHRRCLDARLGALVAGHLRREYHSRFGAVVRVDGDRVGCGGHVHRAGTVKRLS